MGELRLWIKRSINGNYIVDKLVKEGNIMNKPEYETFTFTNMKELSTWMEKVL